MTDLRCLLLAVLTSFLLGGCWYSSSVSGSRDATADMRTMDAAIAQTTPQQARAYISGKTWRSGESSSGPHIHYSAADGRDYAWLPGQTRILVGQWRIETRPDGKGQPVTKLCLRYPDEPRNPYSSTPGDDWHCRAAGMVFHWVRERVDGDPLKLASRTQAPFELRSSSGTIAQIQARANR